VSVDSYAAVGVLCSEGEEYPCGRGRLGFSPWAQECILFSGHHMKKNSNTGILSPCEQGERTLCCWVSEGKTGSSSILEGVLTGVGGPPSEEGSEQKYR